MSENWPTIFQLWPCYYKNWPGISGHFRIAPSSWWVDRSHSCWGSSEWLKGVRLVTWLIHGLIHVCSLLLVERGTTVVDLVMHRHPSLAWQPRVVSQYSVVTTHSTDLNHWSRAHQSATSDQTEWCHIYTYTDDKRKEGKQRWARAQTKCVREVSS